MPTDDRSPHTSHAPRASDLLIAILALLAALLLLARAEVRRRMPTQPTVTISMEARVAEIQQGLVHLLGTPIPQKAPEPSQPWDRALEAVLRAEKGDIEGGRALALEGPLPSGAGEAFRRCWSQAYQGASPSQQLASPAERQAVRRALRDGYAARLMEARLMDQSGGNGASLRNDAKAWIQIRGLALMAIGLGAIGGVLGGIAFAIAMGVLWTKHVKPHDPAPAMTGLSGRGLLLILLGWFVAFLLSGDIVMAALRVAPFLKPVALPLIYLLHATIGIGLICGLKGQSLKELLRELFPEVRWRHAAWALGFVALAASAVILAGMALAPVMKHQDPPQKELMEMLTGSRSAWTLVILALTATVLAPIFEETIFRGTLLPWLEHRLGTRLGRLRGSILAVAVSALAFGAIHLQLLAMPTISILGAVLALAFLRTRNLLTSILAHGCWNAVVLGFYAVLMR